MMNRMINAKVGLVVAGMVLGVASAGAGYWLPPPFWQSLFINLATTFFALAIAVVAVNMYLERSKQREAVKSLLLLSNEAIARFHNTLLTHLWTRFGKVEFGDIRKEYVRTNGDPNAIKPDDRSKIYELVKANTKDIMSLVENLDQSLIELTTLVGWDLDVDLLTHILKSRFCVRKLRNRSFDDSDDAKKAVCEHLIDLDNFSQLARYRLMEMAGVTDET